MININLLPKEEKPSAEALIWRKVFFWALVGAGLVLVIGVALHIFQSHEISTLKADIQESKLAQKKYEAQAKLVASLTERRRLISERIAVIEELDRGRYLRVHLLDELARSVPDYVWLEAFAESGNHVALRGLAFSNLAISRFMDSLGEKTHIDSVYLRVIRRDQIEGTPVLGFEVGCQIDPTEEGA
jgi:type IV pilus assembly protein PilN